jgi:hypothetical protein
VAQELEHQDGEQQDYDKQDRYEASHGVPLVQVGAPPTSDDADARLRQLPFSIDRVAYPRALRLQLA